MSDISSDFSYNYRDEKVAKGILSREGTPQAIKYFDKQRAKLSDYGYWFLLSTCWVSYTGYSDIRLWKKLFGSSRSGRKTSIMKPGELEIFDALPEVIIAYRAKRPGETDWIAYTLDQSVAARMAVKRGVDIVTVYSIPKPEAIAYFSRRKEDEIIVLDKSSASVEGLIEVVLADQNG